jgi:hypothetical protein
MNPTKPDFPHIPFSDSIQGVEGIDGWFTDHFTGYRVIFFNGTWYDDSPNAPFKGYGDIVDNLKIWKAKLPLFPATGHAGFVDRGIRAYTLVKGMGLLDTNLTIVFAGHSQGACDALISSMYCDKFHLPCKTLLYGLPSCVASFGFNTQVKKHVRNYKSYYVGNDSMRFLQYFSWLILLWNPVKSIVLPKNNKGKFWQSLLLDHAPWIDINDTQYPDITIEQLKEL